MYLDNHSKTLNTYSLLCWIYLLRSLKNVQKKNVAVHRRQVTKYIVA